MSAPWIYDTLFAALQGWPVNTNPDYVSDLPRIISLGELRTVRDMDLEIFEITEEVPTVASQRTLPKPADMLTPRTLRVITGTKIFPPLKPRTLPFLQSAYPSSAPADQGQPDMYAEDTDTDWQLGPVPDAVYQVAVRYVARPAPLSPAQQTSWLATFVPDVLFAACLMESEHYLKADDRYADWRTKYFQELMPAASAELEKLKRAGKYTPYKPAAVPAADGK